MPKKRFEVLHHQIKLLILNGEEGWQHGQQLPSNIELTADFKTSSTTMQKVMHTLEAQRLIRSVRGRGRYVTYKKEG